MTIDEQELKTTPMMAQWQACKQFAKDAVLLFRMGDFYEAFYEDAMVLSKELEVVLTKRQDVPMSGVPHHTCEGYIDKLVSKGYRVAVAEQTEDPKKAKGIVKREVVRVVTPGTVVNSGLLQEKANNFIASICQVGSLYGLAFLDLTTAEFKVIEFEDLRDLQNELFRIHPAELVVPEKFHAKHATFFAELRQNHAFLVNPLEDWRYEHQLTYNFLTSHFKVHTLDGFGLKGLIPAVNAAGALLVYLKDILCHSIDHIADIQPYSTAHYMVLDRMTLRNLELTESLNDGSRRNTLLEVLDHTQTPMGGRLLRQWIKQPLLHLPEIHKRHATIHALLAQPNLLERLAQQMDRIRDLERLMMKVSSGYASPRDLLAFAHSFEPLPAIKSLLTSANHPLLNEVEQQLESFPHMTALILRALTDEPPVRLSDGNVIRDGFHAELDELRTLSRDSKTWLAKYQNDLREQTGIKTIKVGYNRMFGYYIEVSKGQSEKMPATFIRRQTLVNAERFVTPELKEYESKVLTAEERIGAIETELFNQLRTEVAKHSQPVMRVAQQIARLDALASFASAAKLNHYVCPIVEDSPVLHIVAGRHPVIEAANREEKFVPNDTYLDHQDQRMLIITGPNMAGKSTYIRQVALLTMMAQIGSFVPASEARIGLVDKVFTRIGASDDLSRGQSTFMVEMTETSNILHNATARSLVILDEIGRGTSTYDGISIAWAVAEYLLTAEGKTAKSLFATHYWELTKLEGKIPGAVNYSIAVREAEDQIIFLRKIVKGGTDKSYGIHVARLAGMPAWVIGRSKEILAHLEENANPKSAFEPEKPRKLPPVKPKKQALNEFQLFLFGHQAESK
jgi:DNA mismatch repair protein MutS